MRYPVKSMLGESSEQLDLDSRGVSGDRTWSVRTAAGVIGSGKRTARFAAVEGLLLLRASARSGEVTVEFPDGEVLRVDGAETSDRLSEHVGETVTLETEVGDSHFDDGPVSLLGSASVDAVAAEVGAPVEWRRFRPNIVLATSEPFAEDALVGHEVRIGTAVLAVSMASPRCVMVDAETADLPRQHGNLLAVGRRNRACLGVIATVVRPGCISSGDELVVLGRSGRGAAGAGE